MTLISWVEDIVMRRILGLHDWTLGRDTRFADFAPPDDIERAIGLGDQGRLLFAHGQHPGVRFRETVIVQGLAVLGLNLARWFDQPLSRVWGQIEPLIPPDRRIALYREYRDGPQKEYAGG